jgi:hypothetical protein
MQALRIIVVAVVFGVLIGGAAAYVEVYRSGAGEIVAPSTARIPTQKQPPTPTDEEVPRVHVDEPTFQFGTMQRNTTKSHHFTVKNTGGAPLTLKVGPTSCKCTLGEVSGDALPPGSTTTVKLEWSALSGNGPFRQTATLLTNDPLASNVELTIEGQITDATNVSPPEFLFDKIPSGESKSAEVFVMAMLDEDELTVSEPKFSDPSTSEQFEVKIEPAAKTELPNPAAKAGARITVTAKPGLPIGRVYQSLSVRTNLADAEKLEIPLIGRVVGDISVHGIGWNEELGVLSLGKVKSSTGRRDRVNIVVRGAGADAVKLEVVSSDPPELKATIGEARKLRDTLVHIPVEIEVPAGTRPMVRLDTAQGEEGRVVLKTSHPTVKELVLGVRFAVER